ncbi:hypothetical protein CAC02_04055 [Streptococcus gallolyticus]|uniref:Uncharacterized protein n=1 Tax=Streptococcus gallolyticus TaxID=315405 RepID=A0A368UF07_9STRE|nr:hypothetical protein CAC02_04055 [Streptococcus gallolyticus]
MVAHKISFRKMFVQSYFTRKSYEFLLCTYIVNSRGKKGEFLELGSIKDIWLLKTDKIKLTKSILTNLNIVFLETSEQFEIELTKDLKEKLLTELIRKGVSIINFSKKEGNFEDIFLKMQTDMEG